MMLAAVLLVVSSAGHVLCHGRLMEPPSRVSAWRLGLGTPTHYTDHQTNCGGFRWEESVCQRSRYTSQSPGGSGAATAADAGSAGTPLTCRSQGMARVEAGA